MGWNDNVGNQLCGSDSWGPLSEGVVTRCFQDTVLFPFHFLFIAIFGTVRVIQILRRERIIKELTRIFMLKVFCCIAIACFPLIDLFVNLLLETSRSYEIIADCFIPAGWMLSAIVLVVEGLKGYPHNWVLRLWWLFAFILASIKLQTLTVINEHSADWEFYVFIPEYCFIIIITILGLWFNEEDPIFMEALGVHPSKDSIYSTFTSNEEAKGLLDDGDNDESGYQTGRLSIGTTSSSNTSSHPPNPEASANILSRITFWWFNPLLYEGYTRALTDNDLFELRDYDYSFAISSKFDPIWSGELCKRKPRVSFALAKTFGLWFMYAGLFKLVQDIMVFAGPVLLNQLVEFVQDEDEDVWKGFLFAFLILFAALIQTICLHQYFFKVFRVGMHVRATIVMAVYQKAFKMSSAMRKDSTVGQIVNHMSLDAQRLMDLMPYLHMVWSAPLQIVVSIFLLATVLGVSVIAGVGVMIILIPLNAVLAKKLASFQKEMMVHKDNRIRWMNEILQGIRLIKLFAWEKSFSQIVTEIRKDELKTLAKSAYLRVCVMFFWSATPILVSVASFGMYTGLGYELTAKVAFTSVALFNVLRFPLNMLPNVIAGLVEAYISVNRLSGYLLGQELSNYVIHEHEDDDDYRGYTINIQNCSFQYDASSTEPTLQDISLIIPKGELIAVVGSVGAGKSALLAAILGDINMIKPYDTLMENNSYSTTLPYSLPLGIEKEKEEKEEKEEEKEEEEEEEEEKEEGSSSIRREGGIREGGIRGRVQVVGSIAYVAQQAWICNATLRENIVNGLEYDEDRYNHVLEVCELEQDIDMLPAGDLTEIGEKGINLSGGQKQRVNLARAVYSNNDIVLMDDPLAAVDAHVGKALFDNCIMRELAGKTRVLVTHQLQHLAAVDKILVLKYGKVEEYGTYDQLLSEGKEFSQLIRDHVHEGKSPHIEEDEESVINSSLLTPYLPSKHNDDEEEKQTPSISQYNHSAIGVGGKGGKGGKDEKKDKKKEKKKKKEAGLISVEERDVGSVNWNVYWSYIKAIGGMIVAFSILMFFTFDQGSKVGGDYWLSTWVEEKLNLSSYTYLGIYVAIGLSNSFFVFMRSGSVTYGSLNSARVLHERLLQVVLRAPMSFFDTTPIGRILNRFSKDVYSVDETLPRTMIMFLTMVFSSLGTILVISFVTPFFLAACLPLAWVYYYVQQYYIRSSREVKRLDSISKSPIYAHFSETLNGVSTIRAYDMVDRFIEENARRLDFNQRAYFASITANRWLGVRLEFVGTCIVFFAALFVVLERDNIDPGLAGLSIAYALTITGTLNWLVRMSTELETQLVAVERVVQYTELEVEAPPIIRDRRPPTHWPSEGDIQLKDFKLRYREGLELVLKGITCHIQGSEKIGVVGRTGAGKSSLMLALFRLVEAASGKIVIDGVDISTIGLRDLRSSMAIIPQDPTLFTGTIRSNLDPFQEYDEHALWDTLDKVHLGEGVRRMEGGLDAPVTEFGENLSVGQRQLMCLGRALLRQAKVMVLDEATAAVDFETDSLIQKTIRDAFHDRTVLTIAHRVHTIMDSDRVMVLDQGRLVEFASPDDLLSDESSMFYSLVHESGTTVENDDEHDV